MSITTGQCRKLASTCIWWMHMSHYGKSGSDCHSQYKHCYWVHTWNIQPQWESTDVQSPVDATTLGDTSGAHTSNESRAKALGAAYHDEVKVIWVPWEVPLHSRSIAVEPRIHLYWHVRSITLRHTYRQRSYTHTWQESLQCHATETHNATFLHILVFAGFCEWTLSISSSCFPWW